jgi:hypothetical protein
MARPLADPLYERLLRSFPATQAYTRADWQDDAMPEPVAHFLRQLLRHYSRREARRLRRARTDWVDYDHPDMETAIQTFFEALESHTRVPANEWEGTLRQATYHATAHLVRPVHVLSDFVFAEQPEALSLPKILWRMQFFGPYAYLREAIQAFARKHDLDRLTPDRFGRFLHRVDERITDEYDADRWLRLLDPLFATARRAYGEETVPTRLLRPFFAEKGQETVEQKLAAHADDGHDTVTPRALHRLIDETAHPPSSPATDAPTPPEAQGPPDREAPDPPLSSAPAEPSSNDDIWGVAGAARPEGSSAPEPTSDAGQSVPLWKQFQQGRTQASAGGANDEGGAEREEPLWARFRHERDGRLSDAVASGDEPTDSVPSGGGPSGRGPSDNPSGTGAREQGSPAPAGSTGTKDDLQALEQEALGASNPPHRGVYVRQLFGGDQTAYRQVLRRISEAESWGEASQIIASDIFRAHKVNIYSDAAVHFTNAVESRFREA